VAITKIFVVGAFVLFGTVSTQTVAVNSAIQIQAVIPSNAAGTADVMVQNPDGQSGRLASGFTPTTSSGPRTISGVSPNSGTPGTQVTITGSNFQSGATVAFGGTNAASKVSLGSLEPSVPTIATGTHGVAVTNPDPSSTTRSGGFTVTAPQSLLAGMTPANFTTPAGWTLVTTQDFESGSMPPGQYVVPSITTTNPHTGSKSVQGNYAGDGTDTRWGYSAGQLGAFSEVYISFYDYLDPNGTMNDEMYQAHFEQRDKAGTLTQEVILDWFGGSSYNNKAAPLVWEPQSAGGGGITTAIYGPTLTLGWGTWTQWELEFKPNTSTGRVVKNDGLIRVYRNGTLVLQKANFNTNGTVDMSGMKVEAGGVYTRLNWAASETNHTCTPGPGNGVGYDRCSTFPNCRCGPPTPSFHRYIDDVILLKKP
jgi:hypothetical protein